MLSPVQLCDPTDCSLSASCPWISSGKNTEMGSLSVLSRGSSWPGDLPDPGIWFWSSALQADCLPSETPGKHQWWAAAAAAKLSQSCPTLCDPINGSPPGSPVPGILQARALEWVAISFSNEWKWEVKVKSLSCVQLFETPWTAPYQAPPSMGFSRQEY